MICGSPGDNPAFRLRLFIIPAHNATMTRPEDLSELVELLMQFFTVEEIRRIAVTTSGAEDLEAVLPGVLASSAEITYTIVDALKKRGLLDGPFFARLRAARPRREPEIDAVAAHFTAPARGVRTTPAGTGPTEHPPASPSTPDVQVNQDVADVDVVTGVEAGDVSDTTIAVTQTVRTGKFVMGVKLDTLNRGKR